MARCSSEHRLAGPREGPASIAAAQPRLSDYRSTITDVTPRTDVVSLSVVGGDSYLQMRAEPGHEVVVLGYSKEPFLRFLPDGLT